MTKLPLIEIYCDSTTKAAGIYIPQIGKGKQIIYDIIKTVNEGEFEAMLIALEYAKYLLGNAFNINIYSDSQLVVKNITKGWKIRANNLKEISEQCKVSFAGMAHLGVNIHWIPREQNKIADALSYGKGIKID